ncbi:MAG: outer membrane beta-barrel protein [Elusimicrobiaceae bacterium]|nr:outer membrane beta-barrel protein [Elusimicrobiaceae bacterium]MBP3514528.1 outer membrane beta-barrel protein [Elusimicrobiaceae bacterium]
MKRLAVLGVVLGVLFGFAASAKAEGITAGTQLVSGYLGGAAPLQESGIKDPDFGTELDWGDAAVSYGASYLFFPSEYFGMGVEINGNNFTEAEYSVSYYGSYGKYKTSMDVYNYMLAFRANVNPQNRVRFYVPFGFGLTSAKGKIKVNGYEAGEGYFDGELSGTSNSFGYFIGAGVEADLGQSNWVLGGEIRYQGFQFDTAKYDIDGISGKEDYSYLSFMAKVGYKF